MKNNMMIDRESVLYLLHDAIMHLKEMEIRENDARMKHILNCIANMYAKTREVISTIPTVDAVPVVRCKDCKHRYSSEFCECRPEDAFCSDGERRE